VKGREPAAPCFARLPRVRELNHVRCNLTRFRLRSLVFCVARLACVLLLLPGRSSAQIAVESRPGRGFLPQDSAHSLSDLSQVCLTSLDLNETVAVREPACTVEEVQSLGATTAIDGERWYAATYYRSALIEWDVPADSVDWDEIVLLRSRGGPPDSVVTVWHVRVERDYWVLRGVRSQSRPEGLLIEVLMCLNGTGGCTRQYHLARGEGLAEVNKQFATDLQARLPDGKRLHKGMTLDLETLRGTWPVAGPTDANCCPSEIFDYSVRLDGTELVLIDALLRPIK
jgi:hypothetical protein